ncbi:MULTISPECIES: septal ring lytic transglycosylase RlpA family protein [unclassified Caulobacter]|uniref:septal ring lytic transglycosylase RlpA family protein n=1 Tax=unclassified Caulobacter TaxID=2648921 RepID=UPI001E57D581|nr:MULTISPECIES: septal ring lytic transglycosylase RlpA family protein [unclassified Caulobacter]
MTVERSIQTNSGIFAALAMAGLLVTACATPDPRFAIGGSEAGRPSSQSAPPAGKPLRGTEKPYQIRGVWYYPKEDPDYDAKGVGSWYGEQFHNRRTANGELFDMDLPTAAHKTLPLPSLVEVTNLDNGRKMIVRVNDRGPFIDDRIIDLSRAAAEELGYRRQGVARVRVRYVGPASRAMFQPRQIAQVETPSAADPTALEADPGVDPGNKTVDPLPEAAPAVSRAEFRVQAGAFANRDNAVRVAAALQSTAVAVIEPLERSGGLLYRVIVPAGPDEGDAWTLREQIVALGFPGATVLRP